MIYINDVTKIYPNGSVGVQDVRIKIEQGEFVFLAGKSGSGKSTLIKLLMKEQEPTKGNIEINHRNITKLTRKEIPYLRRELGVMFQDFRLLPNKTVFENVAFALRVTEQPSAFIKRQVPAALSLVGMQKKSNSYPSQLSGGEMSRIALSRAIVNNPPILLADEPTGNLDPDTAWDIMCLLNDINKMGTTVVVSTHAKELVDVMKKRVLTLKYGRVVGDVKKGKYGHLA